MERIERVPSLAPAGARSCPSRPRHLHLPAVRDGRHPCRRAHVPALRPSVRRGADGVRAPGRVPGLLSGDRRRRPPPVAGAPVAPAGHQRARRRARPLPRGRRRLARDAAHPRPDPDRPLVGPVRPRPPLPRHGRGRRGPQPPGAAQRDRHGDDPGPALGPGGPGHGRPGGVAGRPRGRRSPDGALPPGLGWIARARPLPATGSVDRAAAAVRRPAPPTPGGWSARRGPRGSAPGVRPGSPRRPA